MNNLSVGKKLSIGFGVVLAIITTVGVIGFTTMLDVADTTRRSITRSYVTAAQVSELRTAARSAALILDASGKTGTTKDLPAARRLEKQFDETLAAVQRTRGTVDALSRIDDLFDETMAEGYDFVDSAVAQHWAESGDHARKFEAASARLDGELDALNRGEKQHMQGKLDGLAARIVVAGRVFAGGILAAIVAGVMVLVAFRRSTVQPLVKLTGTTRDLARGNLDARCDLDSGDEVGQLGKAFNAMAEAIQVRDAELARHAAQLEQRVADRTAALAQRTRDMRLVLDTVEQGLISVDLQGEMNPERSAIVERWLGPVGDEHSVIRYLERADKVAAAWLAESLQALSDDFLPAELTLDQMPRRLAAGERTLEFSYTPIVERDKIAKLLIVLTDVTARLERERVEAEQHEVVSVFKNVLADGPGFHAYMTDVRHMLDVLRDGTADSVVAKRLIHTIKGNSAIYGVRSMAQVCHDVESAVEEAAAVAPDHVVRLDAAWAAFVQRTSALLPQQRRNIEVSDHDYAVVRHRLAETPSLIDLLAVVDSWRLEPVETRFRHLGKQAAGMSQRLGKAEPEVVNRHHGMRLDASRWSSLWGVLTHVVRNAVDHGIESAEDRIAAGKSEHGQLTFESTLEGDELVFSVEDDGRGIDWRRIAAKAAAAGLPHATAMDLERAVFADGVSTKETATSMSGRGVGMSAVLEEIQRRGGRVSLSSEPGRGTRVELRVPAHGHRMHRKSIPVEVFIAEAHAQAVA